jgi:hypothetical protein
MAIQPVYLVAAKNLGSFLKALGHAQAPEKMNLKFIEDLGFKSTNDRLFIPLLKAMHFLDDTGKPTARYHQFLDDTQSARVLADGIRDAFSDLFRIVKNAHTLSREQVVGKLKSLGEGKLSTSVLGNMTKTFLELVKLADFEAAGTQPPAEAAVESTKKESGAADHAEPAATATAPPNSAVGGPAPIPSLVYRIEIVLPAVRDQAVYDAIFRSIREHLYR